MTSSFEWSDPDSFRAAPVGRFVLGATYVVHCVTEDTLIAIVWGEPTMQDMVAVVELVHSADAMILDCHEVEGIDLDVVLGLDEVLSKGRMLARALRSAVVVPNGLTGILLSAALLSFAPPQRSAYVRDLESALAYVDRSTALAAHAAASATAARMRCSSSLIGRLRALLAQDLIGATLASCADAMGLSPRTLQRRLNVLATSFNDELRRVRLVAAEGLLRLTDMTIEAIASSVGFGHASRMSATLQRELNVTAIALRGDPRRSVVAP